MGKGDKDQGTKDDGDHSVQDDKNPGKKDIDPSKYGDK